MPQNAGLAHCADACESQPRPSPACASSQSSAKWWLSTKRNSLRNGQRGVSGERARYDKSLCSFLDGHSSCDQDIGKVRACRSWLPLVSRLQTGPSDLNSSHLANEKLHLQSQPPKRQLLSAHYHVSRTTVPAATPICLAQFWLALAAFSPLPWAGRFHCSERTLFFSLALPSSFCFFSSFSSGINPGRFLTSFCASFLPFSFNPFFTLVALSFRPIVCTTHPPGRCDSTLRPCKGSCRTLIFSAFFSSCPRHTPLLSSLPLLHLTRLLLTASPLPLPPPPLRQPTPSTPLPHVSLLTLDPLCVPTCYGIHGRTRRWSLR